jgi:hypothetical protein
MTTIHFAGKFKGKGQVVPRCTIWAMTPKWGQTTEDMTKVNCLRCAKELGITPAAKVESSKNKSGTCACCFSGQKTKSNSTKKMFNHGYTRPGYGYIIGGCPGTGFLPYELSVEGTKYMLKLAEGALAHWEKVLNYSQTSNEFNESITYQWERKQGSYRSEPVDFDVVVTKDGENVFTDPDGRKHWLTFESVQKRRIHTAEQNIKMIQSDIAMLTTKIAEWKLVEGF